MADRRTSASTIRVLLTGAIDYAGLFPPAALTMSEAVAHYSDYRRSADAWALGRFVVASSRLREMSEAMAAVDAGAEPWSLSVLASAGDDWPASERALGDCAFVGAIEQRVRTPADIVVIPDALPKHVDVFYEIPIDVDPKPFIAAIARAGGSAKARTGGVTADAFPSAADLSRFIVTCVRAGVPFKATAGLHHPLRASYRLTYEPDSPRGEMFGFLNVLLAAAFARGGAAGTEISELLTERDPRAIRFDADGVAWRDHRVSASALAEARRTVALSFGSCSFIEPMKELRELGLL